MKKLIIFLFLTLFLNASAFSETLNLVTFDYYPTMYKVKGKFKGCAVEIVNEAFKRMGREITIRMVPMKRGQHMLKNGRADGMFTLYKTPEREMFAYYPELPVLTRVISFYVRTDSQITFNGDISKMFKYSIGTVLGYSYGKELDDYMKYGFFKRVDPAANLENTIKKLVTGRIEVLPHTKLDMIHLLKKMKYENKVKELAPSIIELPVYLAFTRKKKELVSLADKFSDTIAEMKKDGSYELLFYKIE
ncbi:MAG: amino acid ABC transporter substrate-binding protein [Desulfobacteraceae bacterium]|nr:amino acid ABC transporter substrate-binding protein [Desulfobacteraceae bacterium]